MANFEKQIANCVCGGRGRLHYSERGFSVRCEFDPGLHTAPAYKHSAKAISEWNIRQAKMDNLDRKAVIAYHKRTSYGKLQQMPLPAREMADPAEDVETTQTDESGTVALRCIACGMRRRSDTGKRRKIIVDCVVAPGSRCHAGGNDLHYINTRARTCVFGLGKGLSFQPNHTRHERGAEK